MLTSRDKELMLWLEDYKSITLRQATEIIYSGNYKSCSRRLKELENRKIIKSYYNKVKSEKVFYQEEKINEHRLYAYDYIKELKKLGCEILNFKLEPTYLDNLLRPDMFLVFKYQGYKYLTLLEVDYTHYTDNIKMNTLYEKLYLERDNYTEFEGTFPFIIIARPTKGIRYNSNNFEVIYTDLAYEGLPTFLL